MTTRADTARAAADGLAALADRPPVPVLLGFDGFVDSIIAVVDKRHSAAEYTPFATIDAFGRRVTDAAGKSSNFELMVKLRKLGGNGPIMANAMAAAKLDVTYIGCLGHPAIDPVFDELTRRATCHSLLEPGYTDALEFEDGKLMLGKIEHIANLGIDQLDASLGAGRFQKAVHDAALVGMINWVMMPETESIWRRLIDDVLPAAPAKVGEHPRRVFIDLCDPAKRTEEALQNALGLISQMDAHADVVFGMNLAESDDVARVLGLPPSTDIGPSLADHAARIREKLRVAAAVVHPRQGAAAAVRDGKGDASKEGDPVATGYFEGPFVKNPRLSTGAGDNFNAGFCLGLLSELPIEQALCVGTATSGFYVRNAASPGRDELVAFCRELPPPEGG